jgi:hypothetical protein
VKWRRRYFMERAPLLFTDRLTGFEISTGGGWFIRDREYNGITDIVARAMGRRMARKVLRLFNEEAER